MLNTANADKAGVRAVALFEAAKGLLVLLTGFALFSGLNSKLQRTAEHIVGFLHLNPAHELPRIFLETARNLSDPHLQWLAWLAMIYSLVRFIEAAGLWQQSKWAEWFALISCCGYIPFELYELSRPGYFWAKLIALTINIAIVRYLLVVLKHQRSSQTAVEPQGP